MVRRFRRSPQYYQRRTNAGFTLLELYITVVIGIIVGVGLIMILLHTSHMVAVATVNTTVSNAMNTSLERIGRDIQKAKDVQNCPETVTVARGLSLHIIDAGGLGSGLDYVVYRCSSKNSCNATTSGSLQRHVVSSVDRCATQVSPATVTDGVRYFDFTISSARRVDVRLKLQRTAQGYSRTAEIISIFRLRGR